MSGQWALPVFRTLSMLALSGLLTGCISLPSAPVQDKQAQAVSSPIPRPAVQPERPDEGTNRVEDTHAASPEIAPHYQDLWARLRADFRLQHIDHPRIDREVQRLRRHPEAVHKLLKRSSSFLHHIVEAVEQKDVPAELALLPAVESGFRPFAHSSNGAAGLWQFMPATGRMLGLTQHRGYDGRRDVPASTRAALDYLSQLQARLDGDWLQALAAYNCGIGTVKRAIRKAKRREQSTSYWQLDLPGETDAYVPRLLAMARIVSDPDRYGIQLPHIENQPYFEMTTVDGALDLEVAAKLAGVPLARFLALNPAYRQGTTLSDTPSRILLPKGRGKAFQQALAALPRQEWLRSTDHKVRSGDTLIAIAQRYQVSVAAIREANNIRGHHIRSGQSLNIPLAGRASDLALRSETARSKVRYKVRKGDSLYTIARRFSVSINELKRWNQVGRYIQPGQRLTVYLRSAG